MKSSRTPLIAAAVVALGVGVLAAYLMRTPKEEPTQVVLHTVGKPKAKDVAARLRPADGVPEEMRGGERFLEDRWGHLGDVGLTLPTTDSAGGKYFVEPAVFQAWTPKGPNYAVAISQLTMLDESQHVRNVNLKASQEVLMRVENFRPTGIAQRLKRNFPTIRDPSQLPDDVPESARGVFK